MLTEFQEIVIHNSLANLLHKIEQEVEIMVTGQADTKGFISLEQVTKVGTGVVLTCVAIAFRIKWCKVLRKLGILDNQTSLAGHTSSVTSDTSRQDTNQTYLHHESPHQSSYLALPHPSDSEVLFSGSS